jgi:putative phage-type endonuclease
MLNTLVPTETMTKEEWQKYRNQGIGGSDVSAICGISKYKSIFELWVEKTVGVTESEDDSEFAYWGTTLEPIIRNEFIKRTGLTVSTVPSILQHPDHKFMLANIDGIVHTTEGNFIFEAKTASAYLLDEWTADNYIPYPYMLQVQHYMAVTGMQGAYVAALVGGNQFFYHFIERDDELIDMIIALEQKFWSYVETDTAPPIDGSATARKYLNSLFPASTPSSCISLDDNCLKYIEDFEKYQEQENYYRELKEKSANELKILIGDNESATVTDRLITWKNITSERLDSKRLAFEQPEIYRQYLNQSSYRRFNVKQNKI